MTPTGLFVGLATLDVVQVVDRLPGSNEKTTARRTWLAAGGPAAVAAVAFAALGGEARLWTALGSSPAAQLAADDLARAGVAVIDAAPQEFELAVSTAFVHAGTGERAVVSGSGHVPELDGVEAPDLTGVDVILIDGHHAALARAAALRVETPTPTSSSVGPSVPGDGDPSPRRDDVVGTRGLPLVVDAGSHKPVFDDLFPLASDVLCSDDYRHPAGRSPSELLGLGPELVAVSHGGEPLQWWMAISSGSVPTPEATVVDTLGAGDVLHGAYSYWLARGLARPEALQRAVAAATERVRHLGPFAWRGALHRNRGNPGPSGHSHSPGHR